MANVKKGNYSSEKLDENTRSEIRVKRLTKDIRSHVKFIHNYQIFSLEWIELSECLKEIAEVAFSEKNVPMMEKDLSDIKGRKKHGTLWDQEKAEVAIRIVLEEGKLNLCVRLLSELKELQRKASYHKILENATIDGHYCADFMEKAVETVERSLGIIVLLCIEHVESLQICDTTALLELCNREITRRHTKQDFEGLSRKKKLFDTKYNSKDKCLHNLVFYYLYNLILNLSEISEESIMEVIQKEKLFQNTIKYFLKWKGFMPYETQAIVAKSINSIFQTDTFKTNQRTFVYKTFEEQLFYFGDYLQSIIEAEFLLESDVSSIRSVIYILKSKHQETERDEKKAWDSLATLISEKIEL